MALVCLALCCHGARAQRHDGTVMPSALQGIAPAGEQCRRDPVAAADTARAGREAAPDLSCAWTVQQLQAASGRAGLLLADTRSAAERDGYRIPGSMPVGLAELRSKPYWRDKPVVLVGNGQGERELYAACAELKQRGFREVHVLRGGMPRWLGEGQPVEGRPPAAGRPQLLDAAGLWQESRFEGNVVLIAAEQSALQNDLPEALLLPQMNLASLKAALARRAAELRRAPFAALVLVAPAGTPDATVAEWQRGLDPAPVWVYREPAQVFSRYLRSQNAVWLAQQRGPKQPPCGL